MASNLTKRQKQQQRQKLVDSDGKGQAKPIPNDILIHAGEASAAGSVLELIGCVAGIYASFLTWAYLQERITTTSYGPDKRIFRSPLVINTVQSLFATISGYIYLSLSSKSSISIQTIFPSRDVNLKLLLISITQSLASPFGYAALKHIDYITYILAKSCKLLPVMFLHLTIFRRSYPFYKYAVVASVTAGVAVFTVFHPSGSSKKHKGSETSSIWGLLLLCINLLFDGLTNSMQDHIFSTSHKLVTAPQMMVALNLLSSILTTTYMVLSPYSNELDTAISFIQLHPRVLYDIIAFAVCGALGQVFIFHTLSRFGSLVLVTVTVTRKMFSMILSVIAFGHRLTGMQWVGVGLVFGGIGVEAEMKRRSEIVKKEAKRLKMEEEMKMTLEKS